MSLIRRLSAEISRVLDRPFHATASHETNGGCIHRAIVLEDGAGRYFVKVDAATALPMFEAERNGLDALAHAGNFRVPQALGSGVIDGQAWLALEYLELQPVARREDAIALGHALAGLHRRTGSRYGWHRDNFIGATPQSNAEENQWAHFFASRRLLPQIERATPHAASLRKKGEQLAEKLAAFFVDGQPQPSLLHGDLWHGNAAFCGGRPALFDPAVYYGDRETDLAMSELFGGFPEAFYAAYREAWPLRDGHERRKTLYNLYHILNHLNLFGAAYLRQAERMLDQLLAELRG